MNMPGLRCAHAETRDMAVSIIHIIQFGIQSSTVDHKKLNKMGQTTVKSLEL